MGRDVKHSAIIQLFNDCDPICWLVNASRPISIVSHSSEYRTRSVFDPFVLHRVRGAKWIANTCSTWTRRWDKIPRKNRDFDSMRNLDKLDDDR